ncbi:pyridoxal phosphate-dependent decarboxylase family protein [Legionella longbeachae]|uniref:Putative pyridoxal-dependent decarboxylase n=1 Tax=Legionella longbeachae serogroup 1 (strain NSW150) TaxID=661367 RepID=D3HK13_LEGLN|nr:aminotransferase class I/II-fold pyridoxal phosphate-dependent enzyme [Legionella longbeachae]VEE03297.1 pyridoxal-dependent decarboxylase [Legionella oakridgensis]HBD7399147.1 aspartate aminotransferase family protein [Legionella pneumophila]ARB93807.1 aspartate aminotransferase family protein [Legionella longbeachae]ARM33053.1 aspartate aminotransferase family protein [Legionella longbeachae]EEZ94114.1 putative pyridoxal-dependent decarboxylase family protein [Legionella longbeachae D-496
MLEKNSLSLLPEILNCLDAGFDQLPLYIQEVDIESIRNVLLTVAEKMRDNLPYPHPLYAGQMLKPPHPIARLAYTLALWINPNNHAIDGGRASSYMEKQAVAHIAQMFGWETHLGHLCSGGTMANLEALWIASKLNPGKKILASSQAHYTHQRLCSVLGIPFDVVNVNDKGQMDLVDLENKLKAGDVGTVVVTMGTTGIGALDPLTEILNLKSIYSFRIHADCAYGGYFTLCNNLSVSAMEHFNHLIEVDSLVIDPHKHGLQPYGCGCILFKDTTIGRFYKHDSPYTYFSSADLHLGEISLECSRPGASAVALWATHQLLPLIRNAQFALDLEKSKQAASMLYENLAHDPRFLVAMPPELDIVVWAPNATNVKKISELSQQFFKLSAQSDLHLALIKLPKSILKSHWAHLEWNDEFVTLLRSCMMKSEHLDWMDEIWSRLKHVIDLINVP